MIEELYPICLDIGIAPSLFWISSIKELQDYIESYNRVKINKNKEKAIFNSILAKQIGEQVAMLFDEKMEIQPMQLWQLYPNLFDEDKEKYEAEKRNSDLELYKAKMKDFMYRHNSYKKGGE